MKIKLVRVFAFVMVLSFVLPFSFIYTSAEENADDFHREISILEAVGLYSRPAETDLYTPTTRGELAEVIGILLDIYPVIKQGKYYFVDVDKTHIANALAEYGYFTNIGRNFSSDKAVSVEEVAIALVKVLGYKDVVNANGGKDAAYMSYANRLGILSGIDMSKQELSKHDFIIMLYNT